MKKMMGLFILVFLVGLIFQGFTTTSSEASYAEAPPTIKFPKKVDAVIQSKCYGCHSANGKSDKAKAALMWDDLAGLQPSEQAHKLEEISEVLSKGAMPPKGLVEKMPEKALTMAEKTIMTKWAEKMSKKVKKKMM